MVDEALRRDSQGQAPRRVGPGVQAEHRRHARSAVRAVIEGLLAAGAQVHAYDPEAMEEARGIFGDRVEYAESSTALEGRTRWCWSRSGTSSGGRISAVEERRGAGHLRRPQHLQPRSDSGSGVHLLLHGAAMSAVLVTGGAGYIGSHAVKALVKTGRRVVIYDDLSAGHREAAVTAGDGVATLVEGDIRDTARVAATLKEHAIESVMHFAAWLSVGNWVHNPAGYYHNNVTGALSVLEAMVTQGVKQLVFSSTCAVFGNPLATPIGEGQHHPRRPINAYGETKLTIEQALPHYERAYGLRSIALRYFNAAGADPDGELGEDHEPEISRHSTGH